eukprot:766536-Hanusia_phi.AAC.1
MPPGPATEPQAEGPGAQPGLTVGLAARRAGGTPVPVILDYQVGDAVASCRTVTEPTRSCRCSPSPPCTLAARRVGGAAANRSDSRAKGVARLNVGEVSEVVRSSGVSLEAKVEAYGCKIVRGIRKYRGLEKEDISRWNRVRRAMSRCAVLGVERRALAGKTVVSKDRAWRIKWLEIVGTSYLPAWLFWWSRILLGVVQSVAEHQVQDLT